MGYQLLDLHYLKTKKSTSTCPVESLGEKIGKRWKLLCLDEFQVLDIADAMILRGIVSGIMKSGSILMITSNRAPKGISYGKKKCIKFLDLYLNGIQRASFLPCINLIQQRCKLIDLNAGKDYRLLSNSKSSRYTYFSKENRSSSEQFEKMVNTHCTEQSRRTISAMGRIIEIPNASDESAVFEFDELFKVPMSSVDYLAITSEFSIIFIRNVPIFSSMEMREEARRFITFLDIIYDAKVKHVPHASYTSLILEMSGHSSEWSG